MSDYKKITINGTDHGFEDTVARNGIEAVAITNTASGAIASFPDGANGMPLKGLTVGIEPVQDLHGYDAPWPGGYTAQKWDEEYRTDGYYNASGQWTNADVISAKNFIPVSPNTDYYVYSGSTSALAITFWDENQDFISRSSSMQNRVVTIPAGCHYILFNMATTYGTTYKHDISINYPSTDTSYHPYSNICPISGWTGCNVSRTGKNLCNPARLDDDISNFVWGYRGAGFLFKGGQTYTLSVSSEISSMRIVTVDENTILAQGANTKSITYTPQSDILGVIRLWRNGLSLTGLNVQIELSSTATSYEAYISATYPITWQTEAGTVYGGTLDVTSGVLSVDMASVTIYSSEISSVVLDGNNLRITISNNKLADFSSYKSGVCNKAIVGTSWADVATHTNYIGINGPSSKQFITNKAIAKTLQEAQDFVGQDGLQICTKLATPIEVQLTGTEISTLLGQNNIFADTGDSAVEYCADTKLYISKRTEATQKLLELIITANHEDSMKATKAYSAGNLLIVGGTLYKATTSIANGATLTVGTNVTTTTVANELATLA